MHVPAGAIPKDGPSAGVTMATTLVSLLSGHRTRSLTAMTGEITLSGNVLPVGGIKEKVLAAKRAGVTTIILPSENKMNVEEDLTPEQRASLSIHYVKTIEEALRVSLPMVAESLAAKVFMESEPKDTKPKSPAIRPTQEPAVVHDRVVTAEA
jgi:ATP-dependent Lon protease